MEVKNSSIKKQILEEGVKSLLDKAKVPMKIHLEVVKQLHKAISDNKKDREFFDKTLQTYQGQDRETWNKIVEKMSLVKGEKGDKGDRGEHIFGRNGKDGMNGRDGKNGRHGKDADIESVVQMVLAQIPASKSVDTEVFAKEIVKLLKDKTSEYALTTSDLKDIESFSMRMKSSQSGFMFNGKRIKFEELMRGAGGGNGGSVTYSFDLSSQCNGSNKVFTIPTNTSVILLTGTDSPQIYKPTTDYTVSGTTLTLTLGVNAPSLGSTLIVTYTA